MVASTMVQGSAMRPVDFSPSRAFSRAAAELLLALLQQLDQVLVRLRTEELNADRWHDLQPELRRQALTSMAGSYVQIPRNGVLLPVLRCWTMRTRR